MQRLRILYYTLAGSGVLHPRATLIVAGLLLVIAYTIANGRRRVATVLSVCVIAMVVLSVFAVPPRALRPQEQPWPDAFEMADATQNLVAGRGYTTTVHGDGPEPPRYPPGFSIALAPFALLERDHPANVQHGVAFYAAVFALVAAIAAWSLGGPGAGAIAAAAIGVSPFLRAYSAFILSDALAAALVIFCIPLLKRATPLRVTIAGFLTGILVPIRLPLITALPALLFAAPKGTRFRAALAAVPPIAALGAYNWATFGTPFTTGYYYWVFHRVKSFGLSFALQDPPFGDGPHVVTDVLRGLLARWACPCPETGPQAALSNLAYYPTVLVGLFWLFTPPLLPILGIWYAWRHRDDARVRYGCAFIALTLLLFTFYFYQGARFMAASATILAIFASAAIAEWLESRHRKAADVPQ